MKSHEKIIQAVRIKKPDDWHLHLRSGDILKTVLKYSSNTFGRAIIMPNLNPPIVTTEQAENYYRQILKLIPKEHDFQPLMTLFLTEKSKINDIEEGVNRGIIKAVKLYPAGATTNSENGVRDLLSIYKLLEKIARLDIPLLVHGEATDPKIDIFDREAFFVDKILEPLRKKIPELRIVLEHITTKESVDYVTDSDSNLAATITPHHLIINRNSMFKDGIRPHYYCLPLAKRESHRIAIIRAAVSGNPKFFLGTDSAPHLDHLKENACGCAGIFSTPNALSCLAHIFEAESALEKLEGFISLNGAKYYGLAANKSYIKLSKMKEPKEKIKKISIGHDTISVFDPGFSLYWKHENI